MECRSCQTDSSISLRTNIRRRERTRGLSTTCSRSLTEKSGCSTRDDLMADGEKHLDLLHVFANLVRGVYATASESAPTRLLGVPQRAKSANDD